MRGTRCRSRMQLELALIQCRSNDIWNEPLPVRCVLRPFCSEVVAQHPLFLHQIHVCMYKREYVRLYGIVPLASGCGRQHDLLDSEREADDHGSEQRQAKRVSEVHHVAAFCYYHPSVRRMPEQSVRTRGYQLSHQTERVQSHRARSNSTWWFSRIPMQKVKNW